MHVHVRGWVGRPQECNLMSPWVDTHRSVLCPLSYIGGHLSQFTQQLQLYTIGPFPVFHSPNAEGYICIHQSIFLGLVPTGGIFVNTIHTVFRLFATVSSIGAVFIKVVVWESRDSWEP